MVAAAGKATAGDGARERAVGVGAGLGDASGLDRPLVSMARAAGSGPGAAAGTHGACAGQDALAAGGEDAGMDGVVASGLWGAPARGSGEARRIGEVRNRPTLSVYLSLPFFLPVCVCMRRRVYALNRQCRQTTLTSAMLSLWFRRTPSSGDEASGFYLS